MSSSMFKQAKKEEIVHDNEFNSPSPFLPADQTPQKKMAGED